MAEVSETQTASLTDFLLQRIAEDEADAGRETWGQSIPGDCWGPDRVLAECEAHRRIVELHFGPSYLASGDGSGDDLICECGSPYPCPTLLALALPYADHPDYRAEWRP